MQEDQRDPRPLTESQAEAMQEAPTKVRLAKSQVLSIRLSDDELRLLAREARRSHLTVGALIKKAAMDAARTHRFSPPELNMDFAHSGMMMKGSQEQRLNAAAGKVELSYERGDGHSTGTAAGPAAVG